MQASNRRSFLSSAAGGAGVLVGAGVLARRLGAQTGVGRPVGPVQPINGPRVPNPYPLPVSQAVVSSVAVSARAVTHGYVVHDVAAADIRRAGTSLAIFYAHLDEIGATPLMVSSMRSAGVLDQPLSFEQLSQVRAFARASVTDAQFEQYYLSSSAAWPRFKALIDKGGVGLVRATVLETLEVAALRREQLSLARSGAHLRTVQDSLEAPPPDQSTVMGNFCAYAAVAGTYFGTWGYMAWAGAAAFTPVGDAVIALVGLGLAFAGIVCI